MPFRGGRAAGAGAPRWPSPITDAACAAPTGTATPVNLVGLTHNRRFWRGDSLRTAHAMVRLGGGGSAPARTVAGSRAVLDISGGDSFTDLYGPKRFRAMVLTKRMALTPACRWCFCRRSSGRFATPPSASRGGRRSCAAPPRSGCATRDSFAFLQEVLGRDFDPERHRPGVDVAVALPAKRPARLSDRELDALAEPASGTFPLAG
jgi:colanic acid/amylovoran biosynthesis protein